MSSTRNLFRRLAGHSVWSEYGVDPADWRFRGVFRFVLPTTDLLFLWFGVVGFFTGINSVQNAAGYQWQTWWSAGIALSASIALVGVSFPKLWKVELSGKIILISLVSAYVALYVARGVLDPNITALAGLIAILILLPIWRVADLGRVAWEAKRER